MAHGVSRSINCSQYFLLLLHCVPLYVCRLCINFQELCARLLGMATLRIRFSPSFHALLIDFLSIRKVIIFSAIATDDRHPLRSRSIHQNAANCMTIRFRYIAQSRGHGCFNECGFRHLDTPPNYFLVMKPLGNQPWQPSKQRFASSQSR